MRVKSGIFIFILLAVASIFNLALGQEIVKASAITVNGGIQGKDYTYTNGVLTVKSSTPITVSGTVSDRIVVEKNVNANITFNGLKIENNNSRPFDMDGATVKLNLKGENSLKSPDYKAALFCPAGSELTIEGDGTLTATVGNRGGAAAIGGESTERSYPSEFRDWIADSASCGKITINGGTINANCPVEVPTDTPYGNAYVGLAIGGQKGGSITINGGKVNAIGGQNTVGIGFFSDETDGIFITGGEVTAKVLNGGPLNDMGVNTSYGPPIGFQSGSNNSKAKITISGGIVNAVSGHDGSSGIGGARGSSGGIITITGDANVTAKGGYGAAGIGAGYAQNGGGNSCAITIDGNAIVNATGGINAPGIGSGAPKNIKVPNTGNAGVITIAGNANVTAVGGQNATGIGTGASTASGLKFLQSCIAQKIVITENAKVTAKVGPSTLPSVNPSQSERFEEYICTISGIEAIEAKNSLTVDENGNYVVKGNVTLNINVTVPDGKIIIVPKDAVLNVPEGITFTYPSNSNVEGQIAGTGNIIQTDGTLIPSIITLSTDKERYIYGDIVVLTATVSQKSSPKIKASNEIAFYNGDNLLGTKQLVDNSATIEIDTKTTGLGTLNLKAKFSGNDVLGSSEATKSIVINKSNFDTPSGYDDDEYQRLVKFLELPSASSSGTKNGQELNPDYSPTDPNTWTGIEWTKDLDIKKVEIIDISSKANIKANISGDLDLKGFLSLKHLSCGDTQISSLDVTGLSSLQYLYCGYTNINSLDLTGLSNLQDLYCGETNINDLDLTGLSNLQELYCGDTGISNLDLSGVPNLKKLHCLRTNISSLDLSKVPNLELLSCGETNISSLDLTKLSNLQILYCSNTAISSLDLTGLSNLQELSCYNTNISSLDLTALSNLQTLDCSDCKLGINELKKIKLDYPDLFKEGLLNQNIFGSYLFSKGDIKEFGSETSTYKWYISGELIELPTSAYDFSEYNGKQVKCEITDGDITLVSNTATITDTVNIKFDNPPQSISKGSQVKLSVKLEPDTIDKSVSWKVYDSTASTISQDGILNVPSEETSTVIKVRATSNFDNTRYAEINLNILSPSQIDLQTDKDSYIYGDIVKLIANINANDKVRNANKISIYNGNKLLATKKVVNNIANIEIDTKKLGIGETELKAVFSGSDIFESSSATKKIIVNKAKLNAPTNLRWSGSKAVWDEVYGCSKYEIKLKFEDESTITSIIVDNPKRCEYDLEKYVKEGGTYSFVVKALGDNNYNDSDDSISSNSVTIRIHLIHLENAIAMGNKLLDEVETPNPEPYQLVTAISNISKAITEFESNMNK